MKHVGSLKDGRKVYVNERGRVFAERRIPDELYPGPTNSEIKKFEEEHADAEGCPKCGYKFVVDMYHVGLSYEDEHCKICGFILSTKPREGGE